MNQILFINHMNNIILRKCIYIFIDCIFIFEISSNSDINNIDNIQNIDIRILNKSGSKVSGK